MGEYVGVIKEAVIGGKYKEIEELVKKAIDDNADLDTIIDDGMIAAMDVVGQKFSRSEIFVPEMLVSAVTMKKGLDIVKPLLKTDASGLARGTIVMATVKGDIHDIGKNLVIMMLQGAGFNVIDLGVDIKTEDLVEKVQKIKPDILGLSALITTTMLEMKKVVAELRERGLRDSVKIMVGGAPVTTEFAEKVGADAYGKDAAEAVELARSFMGAK